MYALKAKNIEFDDDLRFSNKECQPLNNNANFEPHLQNIN